MSVDRTPPGGLKTECQKDLSVSYEGETVGVFSADIVVEAKVIVELKSVEKLAKAHEIQLVNYLVATGVPVGLLINFGVAKVEVKRKIRQLTNCRTVDLRDKNKSSCNPV